MKRNRPEHWREALARSIQIGPGHGGIVTVAGHDWLSYHYYDGERGGKATLGLRKLGWAENGWPEKN